LVKKNLRVAIYCAIDAGDFFRRPHLYVIFVVP
jgi:hypothetical protein